MGETLEEMQTVLGEDPRSIDITTVKIANAIWSRIKMNPEWADLVAVKYLGEIKDISTDSDPALRINSWVADSTNNKITKLVDSVPSWIKMVITNAVHFKDDWLDQFDKELTKQEPFYAFNDDNECDLMHKWGDSDCKLSYYESDTVQAVKLPYKNRALHMVVILPKDKRGIVSVADLAGISVGPWSRRSANLYLPKFQNESTFNMKEDLMGMGMKQAFSPEADFRKMTTRNEDMLKIDQVVHKTFINVDEEGTEAAAVTGVFMALASMAMPLLPVKFRADHPFTYYIEDRLTRQILFIGSVYDT